MSHWTRTVVLDGSRVNLNGPLRGARNKTMLAVFGSPRGSFSQKCQPVTNERLRSLIVTEDVGPFRVTGLRPAVRTLRTIFADVKAAEPDIHGRLGTAGMLCARFVRDSTSAISNHSWGTAIDLTIDGVLDARGDRKAQQGLLQIFKHFNNHGFYWGAAFPTEDAMHFEASEDLIHDWQAKGELGEVPAAGTEPDSLLEFGDRGAEIAALQEMLSKVLGISIKADGTFGPATRAAVVDFQSRTAGLATDGVVGMKTLAALRAALSGTG
ncbi:peptidoglycan-binding protein [Siccirubricoccus deserti]|uniref:Peptidoglycan-binding protein n=1 Tax=Siccirubricoccus deserti TaxID=2013562 RepID=A0A9X0R3R8_9PROT|nr:peptidoglycan-binding protein [Siccirubricoccus deserti]MBC4017977.1 peptidoglycan-binding protein [Siccirubricoccus deserti]